MKMTGILILLAIGLLAGFVSGTFGVGGGIVIIPALIFVLGFTQHQAQGTSLAMMVAPIGLVAAWNYYKQGFVDIKVALIILAAFFVGSYLGSLLSVQISGRWLQKIFGVLMIVVAVKLIIGK